MILKITYLTLAFSYGVNGIYYEFNPGTIRPSNSTSGINFDQLDKNAFEPFYILALSRNVTNKLSVTYGLHSVCFID
jgi:hypothetical protein